MVKLMKNGDAASVFKLMPVYRHKAVGEKITIGESILFVNDKFGVQTSVGGSGSFWNLHCSDQVFGSGDSSNFFSGDSPSQRYLRDGTSSSSA